MTNFYNLGVEIKKIRAFLGFIFMNFNEVALFRFPSNLDRAHDAPYAHSKIFKFLGKFY